VGLALALVPPPLVKGWWLLCIELALVANTLVLYRVGGSPRTALIVQSLWLCAQPVFYDLWVGQFSLIASLLVLWAGLAWEVHRPHARPTAPSRGAWFWAAATLLKGLPAVYAFCLIQRTTTRRYVLPVLGTLLCSSALYFVILPQDWRNFVWLNTDAAAVWISSGNESLLASIVALDVAQAQPAAVHRLIGLGLMLSIGGIALVRTFQYRAVPAAVVWLFGVWTCAFLLTFKEVWGHHYCFLLPFATFLCLDYAARVHEPLPASERRLLFGVVLMLLWTLLPPLIPWGTVIVFGIDAGRFWRGIPTLLLFLFCIRGCGLTGRTPEAANRGLEPAAG
jgi:hypothetical protein